VFSTTIYPWVIAHSFSSSPEKQERTGDCSETVLKPLNWGSVQKRQRPNAVANGA
jgi:hypothetical protein